MIGNIGRTIIFGFLGAFAFSAAAESDTSFAKASAAKSPASSRTLADLLAMSPEQLAKVDIAEMYLCAFQGFSSDGHEISVAEGLAEIEKLEASGRPFWSARKDGERMNQMLALDFLKSIKEMPPKTPVPINLVYLSIGRRLGFPLHLAATPDGAILIYWASKDGGWLLDPNAERPRFFQNASLNAVTERPGQKPGEEGADGLRIFTPADEFALALAGRGNLMLKLREQLPIGDPVYEMATEDSLLAFSHAHLFSPRSFPYVRSIRDTAQTLLGYQPAPEEIRQKLNILNKDVSAPSQNLLLEKLLEKKRADLVGMDIAEMNLICAAGLPGSEKVHIPAKLALLDTWAGLIDFLVKRNEAYFQKNEALFHHSRGVFKMVTMIEVLKSPKGMKVHYDEAIKQMALGVDGDEKAMIEKFGSDAVGKDSSKMFLTGLLGDDRVGTCASMPVLYVALGRRLGFPVYLVEAKGHLFVRWDDGNGERFNVEGTGNANVFTDDHFKKWPLPIDQSEIDSGQFLKSLTPAEELSVFLGIRATTLRANGRDTEALIATVQGIRLRPHNRYHEAKLIKSTQTVTGPFVPW